MSRKLIAVIIVLLSVFSFPLSAHAQTADAVLALSPSSGTYAVNEQFDVTVLLTTNSEEAKSLDVYLEYDPAVIEALTITESTLFDSYPVTNINNTTGVVTISADDNQTVAASQENVAVVTFRGLVNATSEPVVFGSLTEVSNTSAQDILGTTTNGAYTFGTGGGTGDSGDDGLPDTGIFDNPAQGVLIASSLLFLGIYLFSKTRQEYLGKLREIHVHKDGSRKT